MNKKRHAYIAGRKQPHRFNKATKQGNQCVRALQLLYHAEDLIVTLFVTEADHNRLLPTLLKLELNQATKDEIAKGVLEKYIGVAAKTSYNYSIYQSNE